MLCVLFQLGPHRYALDARHVVEVLPLLALQRFPAAPPGVAGIFVYHGDPVTALDLCELLLGRPAREHRSTRILIVQPQPASVESRQIGLIVERATGTLRRDEKDFVAAGVPLSAAPFLGPVLTDDQGVIQLLDAQQFLAAAGSRLRLAPAAEGSHAPH